RRRVIAEVARLVIAIRNLRALEPVDVALNRKLRIEPVALQHVLLAVANVEPIGRGDRRRRRRGRVPTFLRAAARAGRARLAIRIISDGRAGDGFVARRKRARRAVRIVRTARRRVVRIDGPVALARAARADALTGSSRKTVGTDGPPESAEPLGIAPRVFFVGDLDDRDE